MKSIKEQVLKRFPKEIVSLNLKEYVVDKEVMNLTIDLTLAEVLKVIDEIIVEEEGDSTHDMQIKANIHSQIKQRLKNNG